MQNQKSSSSASATSSIVAFEADWHPDLGCKLEVFPRSFPLLDQVFWPDLASFLQDRCSRQMMYYPASASAWSVQVIFHEKQQCWSAALFQDAEVVLQRSGDSLAALSQELPK
ncbi:MAG TPA: hypothetical protein VFA71_12430 [Terriglobales bacterium]|nr:hypothetical protein [Terriglobales bacterium]